MAKPQYVIVGDTAVEMAQETRKWANSHGTYIAGRAYVDEADLTAAEMETKWGVGRLRLLVNPELRTRFDRQRVLFNEAIWRGELEDVRREAGRMVNAWTALDKVATSEGAESIKPEVWEVGLPDGSVAALVRTYADAHAVISSGRKVSVFALEEIAKLLETNSFVAKAKMVFPGATVVAAKQNVPDPLDDLHGEIGLDEIPF